MLNIIIRFQCLIYINTIHKIIYSLMRSFIESNDHCNQMETAQAKYSVINDKLTFYYVLINSNKLIFKLCFSSKSSKFYIYQDSF